MSYIKAIDVWLSVNHLFVFAALLEFAVVNVTARVTKRRLSSMRDGLASVASGTSAGKYGVNGSQVKVSCNI